MLYSDVLFIQELFIYLLFRPWQPPPRSRFQRSCRRGKKPERAHARRQQTSPSCGPRRLGIMPRWDAKRTAEGQKVPPHHRLEGRAKGQKAGSSDDNGLINGPAKRPTPHQPSDSPPGHNWGTSNSAMTRSSSYDVIR